MIGSEKTDYCSLRNGAIEWTSYRFYKFLPCTGSKEFVLHRAPVLSLLRQQTAEPASFWLFMLIRPYFQQEVTAVSDVT